MSAQQVAPELAPIKTKLEGIIGELKHLQASGTPTQAQVRTFHFRTASDLPRHHKSKRNKQSSVVQLSPVHEQLRSVDEMYVDEKFEVNGEVPAGQAVCADLLSEAHELVEGIQELIPDDDE